MFYEEDWINNILCCRLRPDGEWEAVIFEDKKSVLSRLEDMREFLATNFSYQWKVNPSRAKHNPPEYIIERLPKLVPTEESQDVVNHPQHYTSHPSGVECIQVTEHMNFNCGNAIKYIWRADEKGKALEDLKKAEWYIRREIARRSKANESSN